MRHAVAIITLGAAALACGATSVAAQGGRVTTWTVDGVARQAIVYAPTTTLAGGKAPLVLSFHGHGDNAQNFQYTFLHRAMPEAIVVYFQGLPARDGYDGWQVEAGQDRDRDLKLVDVALASLRETYRVDEARIYSTGFSNGANFTYLLWSARPQVFAAFAPVAARLRPATTLTVPRPVLHVAGTRDTTIAFADQQAAIETAKRANHVAVTGTACGSGCTVFGAATASPVMTWIHQGGHEYPDGTSERIATFFRDHPKQAS